MGGEVEEKSQGNQEDAHAEQDQPDNISPRCRKSEEGVGESHKITEEEGKDNLEIVDGPEILSQDQHLQGDIGTEDRNSQIALVDLGDNA